MSLEEIIAHCKEARPTVSSCIGTSVFLKMTGRRPCDGTAAIDQSLVTSTICLSLEIPITSSASFS